MQIVAWIRRLLGNCGRVLRKPSSRYCREEFSPNLFVRQLEERRVLNGTPLTWDDGIDETTLDASPFVDDGVPDSFNVVHRGEEFRISGDALEGCHPGRFADGSQITASASGGVRRGGESSRQSGLAW